MKQITFCLGLAALLASGLAPTACSSADSPPDAVCEGASCTGPDASSDGAMCPRGQTQCASTCVDPRSSAAHCGACGKACSADEACLGGACVCPIGAIVCGGACTDPRRNPKHCGATEGCGEGSVGVPGDVCASNQFCSVGACMPCAGFAVPDVAWHVPVSRGTKAIATADLNEDGKVDLLVIGPGALEVFRGAGDGRFEPLQRIALGTQSASFVVTDMDGDGHRDVVFASEASGPKLVILYGYGDGTLDPSAALLAMTQNPSGPKVADFNGDGKPDIVVPARFFKGYSVVLNRGGRAFAPPTDIRTNGIPPVAIAAGDFDGDGKSDVVLATDPIVDYLEVPGTIEVLLGKGDGAFGPKKTYTAGSRGLDVTTADLNGDGKTDIVTADTGGTLLLHFGLGDGTFGLPKHLLSFPDTSQVVVGDVTGDGVADVVVRTLPGPLPTLPSYFIVRIGVGDGSFFPTQMYLGGDAGIAIADVNGDGRADILAANGSSNDVTVYLGSQRSECK